MIAVTGSNGYVGGRILRYLRANGVEAIGLVRRPAPGDLSARRYALAEPLEDSLLEGIDTVIHAAYDASQRGDAIRAVNVSGSLPLLNGLAARGARMVMISSMSAFVGAPSLYGRAKLALERAVIERNGVVLRPGLVFGSAAGGMFGTMVGMLSKSVPAPMIGNGRQRLFVTHDERLSELALAIAVGRSNPGYPVFAAHEAPTTLREIVEQIAAARGRRLWAVPLSPLLVRISLSCLEKAGLNPPFRSDSVRSLLSPMPLDQLSSLERPSVEFPPLAPKLWLG